MSAVSASIDYRSFSNQPMINAKIKNKKIRFIEPKRDIKNDFITKSEFEALTTVTEDGIRFPSNLLFSGEIGRKFKLGSGTINSFVPLKNEPISNESESRERLNKQEYQRLLDQSNDRLKMEFKKNEDAYKPPFNKTLENELKKEIDKRERRRDFDNFFNGEKPDVNARRDQIRLKRFKNEIKRDAILSEREINRLMNDMKNVVGNNTATSDEIHRVYTAPTKPSGFKKNGYPKQKKTAVKNKNVSNIIQQEKERIRRIEKAIENSEKQRRKSEIIQKNKKRFDDDFEHYPPSPFLTQLQNPNVIHIPPSPKDKQRRPNPLEEL